MNKSFKQDQDSIFSIHGIIDSLVIYIGEEMTINVLKILWFSDLNLRIMHKERTISKL